jgi:WD40 repeat protein
MFRVRDPCLYYNQHRSTNVSVSFNDTGTKFLTGLADADETWIWDAVNGVKLLVLPTTSLNQAAFALDSLGDDRIVSSQASGMFHVWSADTGEKLFAFTAAVSLLRSSAAGFEHLSMGTETSVVAAVAIFEDGYSLVRRLGVWDYLTGENICAVKDDTCKWFAIGPDDNTLLWGTWRNLSVYDMKSRSKLFRVEGDFSFCAPVFDRGSGCLYLVKCCHERGRTVCRWDFGAVEILEVGAVKTDAVRWLLCTSSASVLL